MGILLDVFLLLHLTYALATMCKEFIGPVKYRCGCTRNTSYVEACSDEDCGVVRETVRFGKTTKRHSECEECKSKPKSK